MLAINQLTPELSELISKVELVVFIDATHDGRPGSWKCETVEPKARPLHLLRASLDPNELLAYAQAVFKASPACAPFFRRRRFIRLPPRIDTLPRGRTPRSRRICAGDKSLDLDI